MLKLTETLLEFLTLRHVHTDHPVICQYSLGFLIPVLIPVEFSTDGFLLWYIAILYIHLSLSNWGQPFSLCALFSERSTISCWFSVCSAFLLVKIKWKIPHFLQVRPESRSLPSLMKNIFIGYKIQFGQ